MRVYFLGAGDIVRPHSLEEMSRYFNGNHRLFLYGDCIMDGKPYDGKFTQRKLIIRNICHQGIIYGKVFSDLRALQPGPLCDRRPGAQHEMFLILEDQKEIRSGCSGRL